MTDNKGFRITNTFHENATVWPISEHYYNVLWDGREDTKRVASKWVADYLADGTWTKIEETLPRSFKFVHIHDVEYQNTIYTFTVDDKGNTDISWENDQRTGSTNQWTVEEARDLISRGVWIVLPSEPEKKDISNLSLKIEIDSAEANKQLAHTIALAKELEESIKSLRNVLGVEFLKIDIEGIV